MTAESYFQISIINGALEIVRHRQQYPDVSIVDAVRQLQASPYHLSQYDYSSAVQLAEAIGWDAFNPHPDRHTELRTTLLNLALRTKPLWASSSFLGREQVLRLLSEDQKQCLEYARLLEVPPGLKVIQWWDQLASAFRVNNEDRKIETGREGERLTIEYERKRLAAEGIDDHEPVWKSIDDNTLGYDILSYEKGDIGNIEEIMIEVKASIYEPVRFIVTRNEWETAEANARTYRFYIWNLARERLNVLNMSHLAKHIPKDSGTGRWLQVELRLNTVIPKNDF